MSAELNLISSLGGNLISIVVVGVGYIIYKKSNCSYSTKKGWDINFKNSDDDEDSEDEHISDIIGKLLQRKETKRQKIKTSNSSSNFTDNTEINIDIIKLQEKSNI